MFLIWILFSGEGQYGSVEEVRHIHSGLTFALKKIRCSLDNAEQKRILREKEVAMRSNTCPYTITFYGALFFDGDLILCMEVMDISLLQLNHAVYQAGEIIPEDILAYIIFCVVSALEHLYRELNFMHRDVKPSNILADRRGRIKVCDFGISGELVNSLADTNVGSTPYLAPERINPANTKEGYTVRSDVWSLGITIIELATGRFPYRQWSTPFDQLRDVVNGDPPRLPETTPYSSALCDFVVACVQKDHRQRMRYQQLMQMPLLKNANLDVDVASFVTRFVPSAQDD